MKNILLWALILTFFGLLSSTPSLASRFIDRNAPFITVWRLKTGDLTVTLPLIKGYRYDFHVNWGDNSDDTYSNNWVDAWDDPRKSHTYDQAGEYIIEIKGRLEACRFGNKDKTKLIEVKQLGKMGWRSLHQAFAGCTNLVKFTAGNTDTSRVVNMNSAFYNTSKLTSIDLSTFNTEDLEQVSGMFLYSGVTDVDLSNFNTTHLIRANYMFTFAKNLKRLNVIGWKEVDKHHAVKVFAGIPQSFELICSPGVTHFAGKACSNN